MGSHFILVLTAAIWGMAFVAQRKSMESIDPLLFNGIRFALGALSVLFVKLVLRLRTPQSASISSESVSLSSISDILPKALFLGLLLFVAATLQQCGLMWTSAGNAGFITGLYVVFVPLIGLFRKQPFTPKMLVAVVLSILGLLLLNNTGDVKVTNGNLLVLVGAVFWAAHVQYIDKISKYVPLLDLAIVQFMVCSILSLLFGCLGVALRGDAILKVSYPGDPMTLLVPVLYAGFMSVGVAFTLQLYGQKKVEPHTASIILCLEGVFALLGGWVFLGEEIGFKASVGALLMLCAMITTLSKRTGKIFLLDKKTAV